MILYSGCMDVIMDYDTIIIWENSKKYFHDS